MKRFIMICMIILTLFAFVKASAAELITFSYYGVVDTTYCYPDCSPFDVFKGQTIHVTYTFESTTPDNNGSANGDYLGAVTDMTVTVGSNTYTANTGDIIITNNDVNPDQYQVYSFLTGPSVGGISNPQFRMIFSDSTHSVYTSDALPTVQPNPSDFNLGSQINLQFVDMTTYPESYGNIISNDIHMGIAPDNNCNGIDEDGNGIPDDGYVPTPTSCGVGVCASTGQLICQNGSTVDTCIPGTPQPEGPAGTATCSDGLDNDCDKLIDTADPDCQYPDLIISFLSAPTTAVIGKPFIISDTTENIGKGTALASATGFYLSKNGKHNSNDIFLGSRLVPVLSGMTGDKGVTSVTIPGKGIRRGIYYIIAVADGGKVISEASENNNIKATKITVTQ